METVTAIYENGVLRPLHPLNLREHQTVRLQVLSEQLEEDASKAALQSLIAAGIITPPKGSSDIEPMSEEERLELANRLGRAPGKLLSEIIIEDRGD
jgi:predicted DNA-binding antitoxin AbrB/MazE fold protein